MSMSPSQSSWPFKLIIRQFLIIVSYAMTINKSQGQSLKMVRVKSKEGLKILIHDKDGNPLKSTINVVYKE
ncbi:hypothetical protein Lal_00012297, partial [Lupinus albus]